MKEPTTVLGLTCAVLTLSLSVQEGETERPAPRYESVEVEGHPMYTVLPMDAIPAIDEPRFVGAAEADAFLHPDEPVLGLVGRDGTAKAYSAWHLEKHEIVNDEVDGDPVAATW